MQAVEATIDAAEVALEELCSAPLQRPCGGRATEGRLPPGIAARAARLAEIGDRRGCSKQSTLPQSRRHGNKKTFTAY